MMTMIMMTIMSMITTFITTNTGIPQQVIIKGKLDNDNDDDDDAANDDDDINLHDNKNRYTTANDY